MLPAWWRGSSVRTPSLPAPSRASTDSRPLLQPQSRELLANKGEIAHGQRFWAAQPEAKLSKSDSLAPGFGTSELRTLLKQYRADGLMIVGHEPDFTSVISELTGASLKLSKAGVALVDVDSECERGRLLWLFPPKFARKAK